MIANALLGGLILPNAHHLAAVKTHVNFVPLVSRRLRGLMRAARELAVRANGLKVDRSGDNLDVVERELVALGKNLTVHGNHASAIVVQPVSVTALLICVEVNSSELQLASYCQVTYLHGRFLDEVHATVELAKFVMRRTRISEYFNAVKAHANVRGVGSEQLLTKLDANDRVLSCDNSVTEGHVSLV